MEGNRTGSHTNRRTVLLGAGSVGAAVMLAACGTKAPPAATGATGGGIVSKDLGSTSTIPVGGGVIFSRQNVVVTQPTQGAFRAFTATCTHAGCQVGLVRDGMIICPCHGSQYSIVDGAVRQGPAPSALASVQITVSGGDITLDT